jgi:hypothetical protein
MKWLFALTIFSATFILGIIVLGLLVNFVTVKPPLDNSAWFAMLFIFPLLIAFPAGMAYLSLHLQFSARFMNWTVGIAAGVVLIITILLAYFLFKGLSGFTPMY